ncbi:MAG: hypothetical protein HDS70_03205 [Bacteroidales bacterium]|nr:hypothetical protein [Bacteroidales bacterium]
MSINNDNDRDYLPAQKDDMSDSMVKEDFQSALDIEPKVVKSRKKSTAIVIILAVAGLIMVTLCGYLYWRYSNSSASEAVESEINTTAEVISSSLPSSLVLVESVENGHKTTLHLEIEGENVKGVWNTRIASIKMKGTSSGNHISIRGRATSDRIELNKMSDGSFRGTYAGPDQQIKEIVFVSGK